MKRKNLWYYKLALPKYEGRTRLAHIGDLLLYTWCFAVFTSAFSIFPLVYFIGEYGIVRTLSYFGLVLGIAAIALVLWLVFSPLGDYEP